jgi:hypothetical protein
VNAVESARSWEGARDCRVSVRVPLRPLHQDARIEARMRRASFAGRPASALAASIAARYRHTLSREAPPGMELAQRRPGQFFQPIYQRIELRIAPRVAMTLASTPARQVVADAVSLLRPPGLDGSGPIERARPEPSRVEQLLQRLVVRETRVESVRSERIVSQEHSADVATARHAGRVTSNRPLESAAPPVPRVVAHLPAPVPARRATTVSADLPEPPSDRPFAPAWPTTFQSTVNPPAVDVERLADQVMRTIDRRVTAQRERRGLS